MGYRVTRQFHFCAGHRVLEHGSKCRHMHGHNYTALVTATARDLDKLGMVIDFSVLKAVVGEWIEEKWDHGYLVHQDDHAVRNALSMFEEGEVRRSDAVTFAQKVYLLPYNPTAENLARYLLSKANELLMPHGVKVVEITLWETANCSASYKLSEIDR